MEPDFYLGNRRWLASYFEKEWFDHVLAQNALPSSLFEFAPFDPSLLYCDSHQKVADFLCHTLTDVEVAPQRLFEIGSSLGRGFYEIFQRIPSLRSATLVEPSQMLSSTFESLFRSRDTCSYPVLWGNKEMVDVAFDSSHLQEAVRALSISLINSPDEGLREDLGFFDLVTCFNVIDNCEAPLALVERLKRHTAPGGILALSCTYQWSKKYLGTTTERREKLLEPATETPATDINELFCDGWTHLNEGNIEFKFRKSERHWVQFLSHVSVFRRS